ncbi:MAG: hypothetical protein ACI92S_000836, partial [Planctomycetaceae bacterium]
MKVPSPPLNISLFEFELTSGGEGQGEGDHKGLDQLLAQWRRKTLALFSMETNMARLRLVSFEAEPNTRP